jgi:hypothetical protein
MQTEPMKISREPTSPPAAGREKMLAGLLERRTCWRLSWRGRFLALALALAAAIGLVRSSYSFLAVNEPVPADLLVVEGWSPTYSMEQVAREFALGNYQRVLVVRAVLDSPNDYESGRYGGDYLANLLIQHGVPKDRLTTLYPLVVKKDRTYHSALAVKEWLAAQNVTVKSLDVGPHARRSHLMYEKAFGGDVKIGIIALNNIDYDPAHWWRTSEGVRDMLGEGIAYMYARFLFHASL